MADPRARVAVKLVDPTTNANEAAVTAAGELKVDLTTATATVTVDSELPAAAALADATANPTVPGVGSYLLGYNGTTWDRLQVDGSKFLKVNVAAGSLTVDSEFPAAGALGDNTANPTTTVVGAFNQTYDGTNWDRQRSVIAAQDSVGDGIAAAGLIAQLDDASTATVTENQFAPVRLSSRRALLVEGVASGTNMNVNLAASAATVTVDSELPAAAALADATANPTTPLIGAALEGYNGTTWDRLQVDASKFLKVTLAAAPATVTVDSELPAAAALTADAVASPTAPAVGSFMLGYNGTTWDRVRTANTGRLQVDVISGGGADSPTSPKTARATSSAVAAGSTATLAATQITSGKTGKLERVICSAAVPLKCDLQTVLNGTGTTVATWFVLDNTAFTFETRHRNYISQAESATAGLDGFQVVVTNQDNNTAGDVYAFFAWDEQ